MPGPLFNFAAFLGAAIGKNELGGVMGPTLAGIFGSAICWVGLFLPGIMLIFGVLPWWASFRDNQLYKDMLPGLNASAVTGICMIAFWFVHMLKLPILCNGWLPLPKLQAPLAVIMGGCLGLVVGILELA